jgi:S-formylglutathione hydrolase FrmB
VGRTWSRSAAVVALLAIAGVLVVHRALAVDQHGARVQPFYVDGHRGMAVIPGGLRAGERRPLLVFLHGRGRNGAEANLVDEMFAALSRLGRRAPVVVFPDGGDHSYWHDRAGRAWGRYVWDDVIGAARRRLPVDGRRVALGGISMGGFGALDLARLHRGRLCAVGAHSPALWQRSADTAPGAFDGPSDFARHDVIGVARRSPRAFAGAPLWLDAGTADPFDPGDRAFVAALRAGGVRITVHRWPGGHDGSYWAAHWGAYLGFYASALARC